MGLASAGLRASGSKSPAPGLDRVDLQLLGGLSLPMADGGSWRPMRIDCRRLLAHLALERGKRLERTLLAYRLWPDVSEMVAVDRLRRMLHELRAELRARGLGDALRFYADRRVLGVEDGGALRVDAATFLHACEDLELLSDAGAEVLGMLEEPLSLGARPLLPELTQGDDWLEQQARQLAERYTAAMSLLRDRLAAANDMPAALRCAERVTIAAPLSERAAGEQMRLLHGTGHRAEALAVFDRCARAIAEEQAEHPAPWLLALRDAVDRGATAREVDRLLPRPDDAPRIKPQGLPRPLSSFHGREQQLARLDEALGVGRMVSILGPGGMGKTRLAVEAAWRMAGYFPDGIWYLPLEEITIDEGVVVFLAQLMGLQTQAGVRPEEQVRQAIGHKRGLVVIDNCEHVMEGATNLARMLLTGCRHISIVATSRTALGVGEGLDLTLGPLPVPRGEELQTAEDLARNESVALFLDRMRDMGRVQALSIAELRTASRICRGVEGVPLAMELAAARTVILPLDTIEHGLRASRFSLLRAPSNDLPERHQALWATIDWSYRLLDEGDRRLLDRLAIFPRDVTVSGAIAVAGDLVKDELHSGMGDDGMTQAMKRRIERLVSSSLLNVGRPLDGDGAGNEEDIDETPIQYERDSAELIQLAMTVLEEAGLYDRSQRNDRAKLETEIDDSPSDSETERSRSTMAASAKPPLDSLNESHQEQRYWMYVSIREFALHHLRDSSLLADMTNRCINHYVSIAADAEEGFTGPSQAYWLLRLHAEYGNFRGVMGWLEEQCDWERSLVIGLGLNRFWYQTDRLDYELRWMEQVLTEGFGGADDDRLDLVKMRHGYAIMLYGVGRLVHAEPELKSCWLAYSQLKEHKLASLARYHQAIALQVNLDLLASWDMLLASQREYAQLGEDSRQADVLGLMGSIAHRSIGGYCAIQIYSAGLRLLSMPQRQIMSSLSLIDSIAFSSVVIGRYPLAETLSMIAVDLARKGRLRVWEIGSLLTLALVYRYTGRSQKALATLRIAWVRSSHTHSADHQAVACYHHGIAHLDRGEHERARLFLFRSQDIARTLGKMQDYWLAVCALLECREFGPPTEFEEYLAQQLEAHQTSWGVNVELQARADRAIAWKLLLTGNRQPALDAALNAADAFAELAMLHETECTISLVSRILDTDNNPAHRTGVQAIVSALSALAERQMNAKTVSPNPPLLLGFDSGTENIDEYLADTASKMRTERLSDPQNIDIHARLHHLCQTICSSLETSSIVVGGS